MKKKKLLFALALFAAFVLAVCLSLLFGNHQESLTAGYVEDYDLIISEICTKNVSLIMDNDGKYPDYIEIFNHGETVNLKGVYLTDGKTDGPAFGDVLLPAGAYRLVFLGDELALSASGGDTIQLKDAAGRILAQTNTTALAEDEVMLYSEGRYLISTEASPGFSNDEVGLAAFREGKPAEAPKLLISELLTENVSSLPDDKGFFGDVAELYNCSDSTISLSGYCLSDNLGNRFRYHLPDMEIAAGEYLVVFCDGENYIGAEGELHANFGLAYGEELCLTDPLGNYVTLKVVHPGEDISLVLAEDGTYQEGAVSLGYPNDDTGAEAFAVSRVDENSPLMISEVLLSSAEVPFEGKIQDVVEIINRSDKKVSTAGWYLSDGGDPARYALPDRVLEPNECLILYCDDGDKEEYTGFSLSERDILRLMNPEYLYATPVACNGWEVCKSIQLNLTEGEQSYICGEISLGYENTRDNEGKYAENILPKGLRISEMMSANDSYLKGSYAKTSDWIELYNASDEDINLADYYLTDDAKELHQNVLPEQVLKAGEYCILLLSDDPENLIRGYPIIPFNLSSDGESIYLSNKTEIIDYVFLPSLPTDVSYGRGEDVAAFNTLSKPTPGSQNGSVAEISAQPFAVTPQGVYDDVEYVEIELQGKGDIYYTTNAARPNTYSELYTGPIKITKTTVIRAISVEEGKRASEILNLTYVVNEYDELPVACLVAEHNQLFSDTAGIMVQGLNVPADEEFPYHSANYWWASERRANLSLFELDGTGFSTNCGVKMFGGYSRALAKKSLAVFFRGSYGASSLDYALYGEEGLDSYESIVLRSCGQDSIRAMMRDPMVTSLVAKHTDVAVQKYKAVNLYINGRYWGIYYIREKINENYVAGNFNVSTEDVTVCMANGRSSAEYVALIDYVREHDLTKPECYEYMCSQVDIQQYMDYIIAEMWICNTDNGNIKFCKTREGKWKWIMYDVDYSFSSYSFNTVQDHLNPDGTGAGNNFSTTLIRGLLENPEFKDAFLRRMAWQMNTIWEEEALLAWINDFEAMIEKDMVKDCARWNRNYSSWQRDVEGIRIFARNRNKNMLAHIQWWFDLTTEEMVDYGFYA